MSQFPRIDIAVVHDRHGRILSDEQLAYDRDVICNAVESYDQLAERFVLERTAWSIEKAELRQQLSEARKAS